MTYPREPDLQIHLHHCNRKQTTTSVRKRLNTDGCSVASSQMGQGIPGSLCGSHSGLPHSPPDIFEICIQILSEL